MLETTRQTIETIIDTLAEYDLFKERFIFADGREYSSDKPETCEYTEFKTSNGINYYMRSDVNMPTELLSCVCITNNDIDSSFLSTLNIKLADLNYFIRSLCLCGELIQINNTMIKLIVCKPINLNDAKMQRNINLVSDLIDYFKKINFIDSDDYAYANGYKFIFTPANDNVKQLKTANGNSFYESGLAKVQLIDKYANPETLTIHLAKLSDFFDDSLASEIASNQGYDAVTNNIQTISKKYFMAMDFGNNCDLEFYFNPPVNPADILDSATRQRFEEYYHNHPDAKNLLDKYLSIDKDLYL